MKQNQFNSKAEINILRNIKKRGLRICRFDKGNGVVVLNESDFFKKMQTILDTPMFERLKQRKGAIPPNIKDEESLRNILDDIKIRSSNFEKDVKNIYRSGSLAAELYGLPKVHKDGNPVLSTIGSANHMIAKVLNKYLKPFVVN